MGGEQDMRKMGGIWRLVPRTYVVMWIGSLALAGIPFFAGYYSKDAIINAAFAANSGIGTYAFIMGILAATLTAFYSWRVLFMTFHGKPRADHHTMEHVHESPWIMMGPLLFLAIGAVISGAVAVDWFIGPDRMEFWGQSLLVLPNHDVLDHIEHLPVWVELAPLVVGLIGIGVAYLFYIRSPELPAQLAASLRPLYLFLYNKWYFDELYDFLFVRPALRIGRALWKGGDGAIIDGLGPDGIAAVTRGLSRRSSALQTGYVYHYAFAMLIGVVLIAGWYVWLRAR
jgi:NADH-quinone oxidoreductase subunit L